MNRLARLSRIPIFLATFAVAPAAASPGGLEPVGRVLAEPELPSLATLVADIGAGVTDTLEDAFRLPTSTTLDGVGYFFYDDGIHGRELWRSDGTIAGTYLLVDLCAGACGAAWLQSYLQLAASSELVYFAADDGVHGQELWVTDGTAAGIRLVRDLAPGLRSSQPSNFTAVGNRVFFTADDSVHGRELWVSDGTPGGTYLVADLAPGAASSGIGASLALNGDLLFGLWTGSGGRRLWRSDGTTAGTHLLGDVEIWQQNFMTASGFAILGNQLLFRGSVGSIYSDATLWVSDGTPAGTHELLPLPNPYYFSAGQSVVYFFTEPTSGPRELWRTDGTVGGTTQVPLDPGLSFWLMVSGRFAVLGDALFFTASDAAHGLELWRTDGTAPQLVADIRAGSAGGLEPVDVLEEVWNGDGPLLTALSDRVVFFANDGVSGKELWTSDGTPGGTALVGDLTPGPESSRLDLREGFLPALVLGSELLVRTRSTNGKLLWRSSGVPGDATVISLLNGQTSAFLSDAPGLMIFANRPVEECFSPMRSGIFFAADDGPAGMEPWYYNPASDTAELIEDVLPGAAWSGVHSCRPIHDRVLFEVDLEGIYASGGFPGDLEQLTSVNASAEIMSGALFDEDWFLAGDIAVLRSDGTVAGTETVDAGTGYSPSEVEALGDLLFVAGGILSVTEGTPGTLTPLAATVGTGPFYPLRLTAAGDHLLFFASSDEAGVELWRSDGTNEGTNLVRDIRPGVASSIVEEQFAHDHALASQIVRAGGFALFSADDGLRGEELWRTDGTMEGTQLLADLVPGSYPSTPRALTRLGEWVYFVAESPGIGRELFRTNGLPGGTELVGDLAPGPDSSLPQELTAAGSELYFSAWTPLHGREPWMLREGADGTPVAQRLADIAPGPLSSSPLVFRELAGRLYLVANDNTLGFELWRLDPPGSLFSDGFESSGTGVWSLTQP